jgi:hypothetical protein
MARARVIFRVNAAAPRSREARRRERIFAGAFTSVARMLVHTDYRAIAAFARL